MPVVDGAASIWVAGARITDLDSQGFPAPGNPSYVTDSTMKVTLTPVMMGGDDIEIKNANGDLGVGARHADVLKYANISIELVTPNPNLEQILCGGTLLSDVTAALGTPTGLTVTPQITLGSLAAATYGYRATVYNAYGETLAQTTVNGVVASGVAGANVISGIVIPATALGARVYGRTIGGEQLIGTIPNIGSQATSGASGTGAGPFTLAVTALTKSIPIGTKFQIAGDTNTTKIVFTTTAFAPVGAVAVTATASQSVTTTIAAGAIQPVLVDTGAVTPNGSLPTSDLTGGPGTGTGYQAPAVARVGNDDGVGIELWSRAMLLGVQDTTRPYWWTLLPKCSGLHIMPRDYTNANLQTVIEGQAFPNPSWGTGPFGDWPFDSTQIFQRFRCGRQVVPVTSLNNVPAVL